MNQRRKTILRLGSDSPKYTSFAENNPPECHSGHACIGFCCDLLADDFHYRQPPGWRISQHSQQKEKPHVYIH